MAPFHLQPLIRAALAEDIGSGDVTTSLFVPAAARASGRIVAKAAGVVSGVNVATEVFRLVAADPAHGADGPREIEVEIVAGDGVRVGPGDELLRVAGCARDLLIAERTALNFLIRLSGIATLTAKFVEAVAGTGAQILDTRKTTPLWRELEKAAVCHGGGQNHRFGLYDAVLVKENHLAFGRHWSEALAERPDGMRAIVETENLAEFRRAMQAGADVVMLDEFSLDDVKTARAERGDAPRPQLEVSGNVSLDNVRSFAEAGVERISIGALTHSAPSLDLSMRISPA